MNIPKKFSLLGKTIKVVSNPKLIQEDNLAGTVLYKKGRIELMPASEEYNDVSREDLEQSFCHELAHFLLYESGGAINYDLKSGGYIHHNEAFVDLLGKCLHQVLDTMQGEYK